MVGGSKNYKPKRYFFRFAERAQTDFGVNAVINWAKEGNLGPEVVYQANPVWL